ncbi:gluzincin family metallopeptidase [Nonlabens ponticola]|uniref:Aminopeptidase n=1 Tax=Nonlabens ponticola TaxID=2496866 RepID=A0A3S9MY16_9FLAO|nr:aminopeptidase [Nonlabens ponticola]AZQ44029.1 aminopeptidase [Nonlabens ponticola]
MSLKFLRLLFLVIPMLAAAQHSTNIIATLDADQDVMTIRQTIVVVNDSDQAWNEVIFLDWANAFVNTQTPLAARFAQDFKNNFEFSSDRDRGYTRIDSATAARYNFSRVENQPDILKIDLDNPLLPGSSQEFRLNYEVKIPENDFTSYGVTSSGNYDLRYWYLHPAVFKDGKWDYFSHKDLDDFYGAPLDVKVSLHIPSALNATSNITTITVAPGKNKNSYLFEGEGFQEILLHLDKRPGKFTYYPTPQATIVSDIQEKDLNFDEKLKINEKITAYLGERLGDYKHDQLLLSDRYYRESPVYGLSSLPDFINPFPDGFSYEIRMLKTLTRKWVETGVRTNPRENFWLQQAIIVSIIMDYQEIHYPDLKLAGKFSDFFGLRSFNAAKLKFNEQYPLLYLNTSRLNLDQAITTPSDELVKYNQELGIPYKAAVGLQYLDDYLDNDNVEQAIKQLYQLSNNRIVDGHDFQELLEQSSQQPTAWFFDDYITQHQRMDWKIKRVKKSTDSVDIVIKNKSDRVIPVSVYSLFNDSIVSKKYIPGFIGDTTVTLSRKLANRVAVNYEKLLPEFSQRDNYRTLKGLPSLSRPLSVKLFKDVEDPTRTEVFVMPDVGYNLYDGLTIGPRFYNGNLLSKPFRYSIKPTYGFGSNKLVGSIGLSYAHPIEDRDQRLFQVRYGAGANTFSYEDDLMYRRVSGFMNLAFRPEDLRSNMRQSLTIRNIWVNRDRDPASPVEDPDYNVFALNWNHSDPNLKRFFSYNVGTEISAQFGKVTGRIEWRKLFKDQRQLNLRLYAGSFIYNDTGDNDFFSFALDRPTDYLFDYDYYGRSEDSGLFSQQYIVAEGGFKSQLEPAFANEWITTANASYSIWKYIFAYGDVGFVKNKFENPQFVYDSGIRLNLLQDFFELYFPVYSNNGWEIAQENYDQKIRFIVTLELGLFIKLFKRRWY